MQAKTITQAQETLWCCRKSTSCIVNKRTVLLCETRKHYTVHPHLPKIESDCFISHTIVWSIQVFQQSSVCVHAWALVIQTIHLSEHFNLNIEILITEGPLYTQYTHTLTAWQDVLFSSLLA